MNALENLYGDIEKYFVLYPISGIGGGYMFYREMFEYLEKDVITEVNKDEDKKLFFKNIKNRLKNIDVLINEVIANGQDKVMIESSNVLKNVIDLAPEVYLTLREHYSMKELISNDVYNKILLSINIKGLKWTNDFVKELKLPKEVEEYPHNRLQLTKLKRYLKIVGKNEDDIALLDNYLGNESKLCFELIKINSNGKIDELIGLNEKLNDEDWSGKRIYGHFIKLEEKFNEMKNNNKKLKIK